MNTEQVKAMLKELDEEMTRRKSKYSTLMTALRKVRSDFSISLNIICEPIGEAAKDLPDGDTNVNLINMVFEPIISSSLGGVVLGSFSYICRGRLSILGDTNYPIELAEGADHSKEIKSGVADIMDTEDFTASVVAAANYFGNLEGTSVDYGKFVVDPKIDKK